MAKINSSSIPVSSVSEWTEEMQKKYPVGAQSFINLLSHWGYATVGHAFGRVSQSFERINIFLVSNYVLLDIEEAKNLESLKNALEIAFKRTEATAAELAWAA